MSAFGTNTIILIDNDTGDILHAFNESYENTPNLIIWHDMYFSYVSYGGIVGYEYPSILYEKIDYIIRMPW